MTQTVAGTMGHADGDGGMVTLVLMLGVLAVMGVVALALLGDPTDPTKEMPDSTSTITVSELGSVPQAIGGVVDYDVDRDGGTLSYTTRDANGDDVSEQMPITGMTQVTVTDANGRSTAV